MSAIHIGTAATLAQIVTTEMERQGVTVENLAQLSGVGTLFIKDICRGQARPEQDLIITVLSNLGIVAESVPDNGSLAFAHLYEDALGSYDSNEEPTYTIESKEEKRLRLYTEKSGEFLARTAQEGSWLS